MLALNSTNVSTSSEIGNGWTHTLRRQIVTGGVFHVQVLTGTGQDYLYSGRPPSYQVPAPSSGAVNSLFAQSNYAGFTETQPDGTVFTYGCAAGGRARAASLDQEPRRSASGPSPTTRAIA